MRRDQENQALGRAPLSARIRVGPNPRISIRARGVSKPHSEAEHTTAPDHMFIPTKNFLHSPGRPHTAFGSTRGPWPYWGYRWTLAAVDQKKGSSPA